MQMMTRKKWMPTTLMVLVSMVALGGLLLVNPGNTLLSTGEGAWAASSAPGLALVPARAAAAARSALVLAPPAGAPPVPSAPSLALAPARASAVVRWARALALPPGAPPGLQWLPQEAMCGDTPASFVLPTASKGGLHETYRKATRLVPTQLECAMFECWRKRQPWQHRLPTEEAVRGEYLTAS